MDLKKMLMMLSWSGFSDILIQKSIANVTSYQYTSSENGALCLAGAKDGIFLQVVKEIN